jgi:hypothetical protein
MTLEQMLFVAFLAVIFLINAVARAVTARSADETAADRTPRTPEPPRFPARMPKRPPSRAIHTSRSLNDMANVGLRTMTPASRRRLGVRLGSIREMRRGIVLMTVLRPCRGLEPPDLSR